MLQKASVIQTLESEDTNQQTANKQRKTKITIRCRDETLFGDK